MGAGGSVEASPPRAADEDAAGWRAAALCEASVSTEPVRSEVKIIEGLNARERRRSRLRLRSKRERALGKRSVHKSAGPVHGANVAFSPSMTARRARRATYATPEVPLEVTGQRDH